MTPSAPPGRRRGLPIAAGALLVAAGLLAGCAGTPGPQAQEPPPLSSLLPTPTPTASPRSPGEEVSATVRAYIDAVNVALRTGDTAQARRLSTEKCSCRGELTRIAAAYKSGVRFDGSRIDVAAVSVGTLTAGNAQATVTYNSPPSTVVSSKGQATPVPAVANKRLDVALIRTGGHWLVSAVRAGEKPRPTSPGR